ncbi:MAG: hypothetical protein ABI262_23215, partial [Microcoleus sp.]
DNFSPGNAATTPAQPRAFTQVLAFALDVGAPGARAAAGIDLVTGSSLSGVPDFLTDGGSQGATQGSDNLILAASTDLFGSGASSLSPVPSLPDVQAGANNAILDAIASQTSSQGESNSFFGAVTGDSQPVGLAL